MTDPHQASERIPFPAPIPYIESLGVELLEMADGRSVAAMTPKPEHRNSWGVVHGGVLMALLDFAMSMASRSAVRPAGAGSAEAGTPSAPAKPAAAAEAAAPPTEGSLTVEMKTSFLRPARGRLTVTGRCLQPGRSLSFCEAEIADAGGALIARASGTFKFWSKQ
ncbi:MAG: PaaI family thioesterase [Burkholderiaceae bacterium]|nr:PaaI family thioesterase [Burkholderiaceae bacterium]